MTVQPPLMVAVVGVGRMGQHHARAYSRLAQAQLLAVVDQDAAKAQAVAAELGCAGYTSVEQLLRHEPRPQAVSVAVPTVDHLSVAQRLLDNGVACLVEKPLACDSRQAQALVDAAQGHGAVLQVGHTERFNPALRTVLDMNITARFMEVHRVSPMTFRSLDVGVVMDLMIHDLDIVLMLARSPLARVEAAGVAVLGPHEDIANARLTFESGCVANVTASRLALKTERKMRLFSEQAYVSLDYGQRRATVIRKSDNREALLRARAAVASGSDLSDVDYTELVHVDQLTMDPSQTQKDALTAELESFLLAVGGGVPPAVSGREGLQAIAVAERVVAAVRAHRWEGIGEPVVR